MYLMCSDISVMRIDIYRGIYKVMNENLLPYPLRGAIKQETENNVYMNNYNVVMSWLAERTVSISKCNVKKLLNAYRLSQSQDFVTKAQIAVKYHSASIIDNYWINDDNMSKHWNEVNLRHIPINEVAADIILFGISLVLKGAPDTPELTGKGSFAQAWRRESGELYLYKRGSFGRDEPKIEASVSRILDCFNVPHVEYELGSVEYDGKSYMVSKCKNIATDEYSMVPAEDVYIYCKRNGVDFHDYVMSIDAENINKMNIIDYLISNPDRHLQNWGFYMNNKTGQLTRCYPLLDHNKAFDELQMQESSGGESRVFQGSKWKIAEKAMEECDLCCIKPVTRDMFVTEEMYESFMMRAVELGLYKENEKTFAQKLHLKKHEKYVPVSRDTVSGWR